MDLFPTPAPNFDDPLGMLKACHQRILDNCDTLERLDKHIKTHGVDKDAGIAATKIMRYFSTSAVHHHEDEEQDLFPLLKNLPLLNELLSQHQALNAAWKTLEPDLKRLSLKKECATFEQNIKPFCQAYRAHVKLENTQLLPIAAEQLTTEQLKTLGTAMQQRRQ